MKSLLIKNLKRRKTPWAIRCSLKSEMVAIYSLFKLGDEEEAGEAWRAYKKKTCFVLTDGEAGVVDATVLNNTEEAWNCPIFSAQDVINEN